jgi:hypothetical protein
LKQELQQARIIEIPVASQDDGMLFTALEKIELLEKEKQTTVSMYEEKLRMMDKRISQTNGKLMVKYYQVS